VCAVAGWLILGLLMAPVADPRVRAAGLTEEQRILHLLNRIGYGPRPGDLERVQRMGLTAYLDQPLHPERLEDAATETQLAGLASLRLPIVLLSDRYPEPAMLARELGARSQEIGAKQQDPDFRQQMLAYYTAHGLQQPQRLLQELQAHKLIRAVYSERQLLEVMADFWFNHFNVFWGKEADRWFTAEFELRAIRPHALGRFRELLRATA
jgi:uncharacterized protein (DUF1800 family)